MRSCIKGGVIWFLGLGLGGAKGVLAGEEAPAIYPAVTHPSEERSLGFSFPGIVREVQVKEGERVKQGQVLMKLDDRIEVNNLQSLKLVADSTLRVDYAQAELAQKKVVLKRLQELAEKNAASPTELEEAVLGAQLAETRLRLSEEEAQTKKLEMERQKVKVELMQIVSPIEGVVQRVGMKEGEVTEPGQTNRPAAVVVKNDPLQVEVYLPAAKAADLKPGEALEVKYPGEQESWQKAVIKFLDPVADAGSGLRMLHLELPNPQNREAGRQVSVRMAQP